MRGAVDIVFPSMSNHSRRPKMSLRSVRDGRGHMSAQDVDSDVSRYLYWLSREVEMKQDLPQWAALEPGRISIRLHHDWFQRIGAVEKFFHFVQRRWCAGGHESLIDAVPQKDGLSKLAAVEVVLSASKLSATFVSGMRNVFQTCSFPIIVFSDLAQPEEGSIWDLFEDHRASVGERHLLGFEFQSARYRASRSALRKQIRAVSLSEPDFIRIVQRRSRSVRCPGLFSAHELLNSLSRDVAAFGSLGYEPIGACSHTLLLSRCLEPSMPQIELPEVVLGLGLGAESYRRDRSKRPVLFRNPECLLEYERCIGSYEKNRNRFRNANRIPYINEYIERQFRSGKGLSYELVEKIFDVDLEQLHPGLSSVLQDAGLMIEEGKHLRLADGAEPYSNQVARNFFLQERDLTKMRGKSNRAAKGRRLHPTAH